MTNHPIVALKRDLTALHDAGELALPDTVPFRNFQNAAVVAVTGNPDILKCSKASLFKAIRTLAAAGLVPDGREAAIVPFKNEAQAMPMVAGIIKVARNSGKITSLWAEVVYKGERLKVWVADGERKFDHVNDDGTELNAMDRGGEIIGAYAVAKLTDGTVEFQPMSRAEIEKRRRASANQRGDQPTGVWRDWYDEMAKKTVIRNLCKRLPMSADDIERIMQEQDGPPPMRDVSPEPSTSGFAARAAAARRSDEPDQQQDEPEVEDADTIDGEISDGHPEPDPNALEYAEGETARRDDVSFQDCPYEEPEHALNWQAGWTAQDAKITEEEGE